MRPGIANNLFRLMTIMKTAFHCRSVCNLWLAFLAVLGVFGSGCQSTRTPDQAKGPPPADWIKWQQKRHQSIAGTNGWTTLIALHWLPQGSTFAGADPTNQLVLPTGRAPSVAGDFFRSGNSVRFEAAPGVVATADGAPASGLELKNDASDKPSKLRIGPLSFVVIDRGGRLGLRVRDPESPARLQFAGLQYFPFDPSWRIEGRFEAFPAPRTLRVPDATGGMQELSSPGALVFTYGGKEYQLDAVDEGGGEDYFIITDKTAGDSTYDAGRFLYVARPDATGRVTIDFNRAFTPPCGFTPFATCPRPPPQNWLPFAIEAGERKPSEQH